MLSVKGAIGRLNFDEAGFRKTLDEACAVQLRQAARAWLRAVIPKVPVWTGEARGSLQPLARYLRVAIPINPVARRAGHTPEGGASQSQFSFTHQGSTYIFDWSTEVLHFKINDYYNVSAYINLKNPTPWHAIEAGNAAFEAYVRDVLPGKLPNIVGFISDQR